MVAPDKDLEDNGAAPKWQALSHHSHLAARWPCPAFWQRSLGGAASVECRNLFSTLSLQRTSAHNLFNSGQCDVWINLLRGNAGCHSGQFGFAVASLHFNSWL